MLRTFEDCLRFLNTFTDYERMAAPPRRPYTLGRMRRLVAALGHPERGFRSLHIAGTKGKGSVAHMTEAILREAGHRTGLYTSPHLVDMRERIRLDGHPVPRSEFTWAMRRMEPALRRLRPSYFETMTAAAFLIFARRRVDWAVIEVGLGGRLDATNVILPEACAITTIDYDHMDRLGHTLRAIAREKAGIIKPGVPVVTSPQPPGAMREIRRRARPERARVGAPRRRGFMLEFRVKGLQGAVYRCALRALGSHPAVNAGTAIALVEAAGAGPSPAQVRRALGRVRLPGRIEVVSRRPWVIVDVAHNPVAARALAEAIRRFPPRRRTILVFGASVDKEYAKMLAVLQADVTILTRANVPRAAAPELLARHVRGAAVEVSDVERAMALALKLASPRDAVVVAGSFYVAGEAMEWLGRTRI